MQLKHEAFRIAGISISAPEYMRIFQDSADEAFNPLAISNCMSRVCIFRTCNNWECRLATGQPLSTSLEDFQNRLEHAKAFQEEDRRNAAMQQANSPQAQLAKRISEETGEDIFKVAMDMAKEKAGSVNASSTVEDRVEA